MKRTYKKALTAGQPKSAPKKQRRAQPKLLNRVALGVGFPRQVVVTHKYCDYFTLTSTGGVTAAYRFSANGLYDPNITGTGHQPMYFDQYAGIYNHYVVIGSKCRFRAIPNSTTEPAFAVAGLLNDDTTSVVPSGGITTAFEESQGTEIYLFSQSSSETCKELEVKYSSKRTFGAGPMSNVALQGTGSANPSEQSYFDFYVSSLSASNATVAVIAEIEYITIWSEVRDMPPS